MTKKLLVAATVFVVFVVFAFIVAKHEGYFKKETGYTPILYNTLLEVEQVDPSSVVRYEDMTVEEVWMDLKCTPASEAAGVYYIRAEVARPGKKFESKNDYIDYIKGVEGNLKEAQIMIFGASTKSIIPGKRGDGGIVKVVEYGKRRVVIVPREQLRIISDL